MTNINIHTTSPSIQKDLRVELPETQELVAQSLVEDNSSLNHVAMFEKFLSNRTSYSNARDALVAVAAILNQVQMDTAKSETNQAQLNGEISIALTETSKEAIKKVLAECQKFLDEAQAQRDEQRKQEESNGILNIIFGAVEVILGIFTSNPALIFAGCLQITMGSLMVSHNMEAARDLIAKAFEPFMSKDDAKLAADLFILAVVTLVQSLGTGGLLGFVEGLTMGLTLSPYLAQDLAKSIVNHQFSDLSETKKTEKAKEIEQDFGYALMALTVFCTLMRAGPALIEGLKKTGRGAQNIIDAFRQGTVLTQLNQARLSMLEALRTLFTTANAAEAAGSQKTLWEKLKDAGSNLKSELLRHPRFVGDVISSITSIVVNSANAQSNIEIAKSKKEQARIKRYWALLEAELLVNNGAIKTAQDTSSQQIQGFNSRLNSHRRMIGEVLNAIDTEGSSYVQAMQA